MFTKLGRMRVKCTQTMTADCRQPFMINQLVSIVSFGACSLRALNRLWDTWSSSFKHEHFIITVIKHDQIIVRRKVHLHEKSSGVGHTHVQSIFEELRENLKFRTRPMRSESLARNLISREFLTSPSIVKWIISAGTTRRKVRTRFIFYSLKLIKTV